MRNGGTLDAMVRAISSATETILFGIDVDGIFGPITDGRVRDFQLTFGATVDGIVGPETWLLLVSPKSE
ncbi:MAG: peptidoglycan-binding protein [Actinomycetota bacterium]|nr:peptidoglycan-binding protein [Actinomycetota bacterium]